jgi:hypothetical protein
MSEDFISIYEDTVSPDICKELVYWFDQCSEQGFTIGNMITGDGIKRTTRLDEVTEIPSVHSNSLPYPLPAVLSYWEALNTCLSVYSEKYSLQNTNLSSYAFKIHKVKLGGGYHKWHWETETVGLQNRVVVFMTYLKAPEEGGETEFLYQSKRIKPVIGRTLLWPAGFTHMHRGNPPLKGEKYYITGWFEIG